jgi:hypothetical protein
MPAKGDAAELIGSMPFDLQFDLRGYVRALEESVPSIFDEIGARPNEGVRQEFLYLAVLRKTWNFVDSQYIALRESLRVLGSVFVTEVDIGQSRYGPETQDYADVASTRNALRGALAKEGMFELIAFSSLKDLAVRAMERRGLA